MDDKKVSLPVRVKNDLNEYREILTCLTQIAQQLNEPESSPVVELFDECCTISNDIINQETDALYLDAWHQIAHTLQWQKKTWIDITERQFDDLYTEANETDVAALNGSDACAENMLYPGIGTCGMDVGYNNEEDSKASARKLVIAMTRLDPGPGGLDNVAGLGTAKQLLKEAVVLPMRYPQLFTGGRRAWNKVLLYGPPGTGKTRLAQATASEVGATFYSISSADILSSWVGESEKLIRELFQYPRDQGGQSVIFVDEVDGLCRLRTLREEEHTRRIKTELLSQLEGKSAPLSPDPVFVLCATNCPWELDPAFLRRFQRHIYIPLPDRVARYEIMLLHMKNTETKLSYEDWQKLLDLTDGYSGSDLANLTLSALLEPLRDMNTCTYWAHTNGGKLRPCAENTPGMIKCCLQDLPPDKVAVREVLLGDFLKALTDTPRTVTKEDIAKYEDFSKKFGKAG